MAVFGRITAERAAGLAFVLALHGAALWALWSQRLIPAPAEAATLFVNFIAPPPQTEEPKREPPPKPRAIEKAQPRQLVAETPMLAAPDPVAPVPPPAPAPVIEAPPAPVPAGPVTLSAELSLGCPQRSTPAYPAVSRRLGETGVVVLRVELAENGEVAEATVKNSSGYPRLDNAALNVVRNWRCNPATRNGRPVRAVALQPFNFILQGN